MTMLVNNINIIPICCLILILSLYEYVGNIFYTSMTMLVNIIVYMNMLVNNIIYYHPSPWAPHHHSGALKYPH